MNPYFLLKKVRSSSFIRNALVLTSGTVIAQVIAIATVPIVSRIYLPADYGILGYYITLTTLLGTLAPLQYQNAVILADNEEEAKMAVALCIFTSFIISFASFILFLTAGNAFARFIGSEGFYGWMLLAPISICASGVNAGLMAYANRQKKFRLMSFNRILAALLIPAISISLGLMTAGALGLIVSILVSHILPTLMLTWQLIYRGGLRLNWNKKALSHTYKKYIQLPRYSLPAEFINNFINNLPVLVLGKAYGASTVGHFNMSNRMLGLPVQLVSASVSEVFRQRASTEYRQNGQCERFFKKTFWSLAGLSIVPFAILVFFGPQLFSFFLGGNWVEAGVYSGILAPVFFLRFTVSPLTYMFFVAGKQREDFIMHLVMLLAVFACLWIAAANTQNVLNTLIAYSVIYCLIYLYYLARSFTFAKGNV